MENPEGESERKIIKNMSLLEPLRGNPKEKPKGNSFRNILQENPEGKPFRKILQESEPEYLKAKS